MSEWGLRLYDPAPSRGTSDADCSLTTGAVGRGPRAVGEGPLSSQLSKCHLFQTLRLAFRYTQTTRGTGYLQHKQLFVCCLCLFAGI